jgi:hypothetical protein
VRQLNEKLTNSKYIHTVSHKVITNGYTVIAGYIHTVPPCRVIGTFIFHNPHHEYQYINTKLQQYKSKLCQTLPVDLIAGSGKAIMAKGKGAKTDSKKAKLVRILLV